MNLILVLPRSRFPPTREGRGWGQKIDFPAYFGGFCLILADFGFCGGRGDGGFHAPPGLAPAEFRASFDRLRMSGKDGCEPYPGPAPARFPPTRELRVRSLCWSCPGRGSRLRGNDGYCPYRCLATVRGKGLLLSLVGTMVEEGQAVLQGAGVSNQELRVKN